MSPALKTFTRSEVEAHNAKSSTWLVIENKVYDVTPFLEEHPGGIEVLLEHAGRDATEGFEDAGHSNDAKEIRERFLVGEIVESEKKHYEQRANYIESSPMGSIFNAYNVDKLVDSNCYRRCCSAVLSIHFRLSSAPLNAYDGVSSFFKISLNGNVLLQNRICGYCLKT
ncbi:cytochrome b5-like Heme/Steroid binding domain protein [Trichuris suis]|nr:cytochrome b5-like Heme/Steroid binding domain protein [Trichuris suis]